MFPTAVLPLALLALPAPQVRPVAQDVAHDAGDVVAERAVAALVSDARARETVRELVAFGPRMGGTPSGDRAASYLAEQFAALGLAVQIVEDDEKWAHWEESWFVRARIAGEEEALALESAWPHGFSPAGEGSCALALEPSERGAWLSERSSRAPRGAAQPAVVLLDGASTADGRYPRVRGLRPGDRNSTPVFGLGRLDGERLRAALAAGRAVEIEYGLVAHIERRRPKTVVAILPAAGGAAAADGHLLFCAHGDSDAGGPGANDNASGEAVVLEIARAWVAAIEAGTVARPAREVRFAIWGSEIHSTSGYRELHLRGDAPVIGVVNFDQAGFGSGAEQLNVEPDDLPANEGMVRIAAAVLGDHIDQPGFPGRWATNKSLGGTDSYVFSGTETFRAGRPAVTLFTSAWDSPEDHPRTKGMPGESWRERDRVHVDYDAYYHSAGDLPENTTDREPHNMGWCARVGLLAGRRWLLALD